MTNREENIVENSSGKNPVSFFKIVYKNLILIILITIFCGLCGTLYSVLNVKPVYTASRSVILRTSVKLDEDQTSARNDATLAKIYLGEVEKALKSPNVILLASDKYNMQGEKLFSSAVSVNYGTESLIFSVSYTDTQKEVAINKLEALISAASEKLEDLIMAEDVTLINVQNKADVSVNSSFNKYIIFGVLIGIVISLVVTLIRYALDNTVKNKYEYEHLTGVSVIAVIDRIEDKKNKR